MKTGFRLPKIHRRKKDAHKGDFGRVLVVAGSRGMAGAACLASEAALRSGSGLVLLAVPQGVQQQAASRLPCVITIPLPETHEGTIAMGAVRIVLGTRCNSMLVGPGLGRNRETDLFVSDLVAAADCPIAVDADALNALAGKPERLRKDGRIVAVTPHPGEMAALTGTAAAEVQSGRTAAAENLARIIRGVVVLKGAGTVVTDGSRTRINSTGNPGMATAGSGDVLAGIVASLLGQGFEGLEAAALAAHVHGMAGDIAAGKCGEISMTASDILDALPAAFRHYAPKTRDKRRHSGESRNPD